MKMKYKVEGSGEPMVLVPGGLTGCISWEPHAQRLSASREVIRVQLLSVELGLKNKSLPQGYDFGTESEALRSAVDEVVPEVTMDIVGWSFGGAVALNFALDNPDRVRTLTLIEPPAFWVLDKEPEDLDFKALKRSAEATREDVDEDQLVDFLHLVSIVPSDIDPRTTPQWPTWVKYRRSLRGNIAPFVTKNDVRKLSSFQPPVMLVKGTGSARFLHAVIDALERRLPNSEVIELPSGHAPHIVSMDRFLEKMALFQAEKYRLTASPT